MTAYGIGDRIHEWMADQIKIEDPLDGDGFGYHAALQLQQKQTPQGIALAPLWAFVVSIRSPFLGQPPINATTTFPDGNPPESVVRALVKNMTGQLRQAFEQQKTSMVRAPGLGLPGLPGVPKQGPN